MKKLSWTKDQRRRAGAFLGLALLCGLTLLYCLVNIFTIDRFGTAYSPDEENYIDMARNLLEHGYYSYWGGEPDAYVSPGYPVFLTLCMALFGTDLQGIDCIKFVQAFLVCGTAALVFAQVWLLTKKYSMALIAAALQGFNGCYPYYSRRMLTEVLFAFLMMLFFVVFTLALQREKKWLHFLSGLLFCAAVFVRPLLIIVLPVLYLPLLVKCWRQWKKIFLPLGLFLLGFVLLGLPWWIRNLVTLHKFVFLATQTNPLFYGIVKDPKALGLEDPHSLLGNILLFFQLLVQRPVETLRWILVEKFNTIFMAPGGDVQYLPTITDFVKLASLFLGLAGALRAFFSKKLVWAAIPFFLYFLAIFAFVPTARFALQYWPLLACFAGFAVGGLFTGLEPARWPFGKGKGSSKQE